MRIYFSLVAMLLLCLSHHVCASVVMTGTRIIYPAQASNKSIQLKIRTSNLILFRFRSTMAVKRNQLMKKIATSC